MRWLSLLVVVFVSGCGRGRFDERGDAPPVQDVTSGLMFSFTLDQLAGHSVAELHGNNGYVWSETNVVPITGKVGGGLHFDGTPYQGYAVFPSTSGTCGNSPVISSSLTVSTWIQFDVFHDWNHYTLGDVGVMQGSTGGNGGGWGLGATNGCATETAGFTISPAVNRTVRCGSTSLATAQWYYLTGVYDAQALTLDVYVDGKLDSAALAPGSIPVPSAIQVPSMCPYLGASGNQMNDLVGALDEVRVYSRALSAGEVHQLYLYLGGT